MQIFQTVTVTMSQEIPRVLPDVLAPTPCPTLSRMKGCSESVGKKFTWRKNKHRVECGGEGRALHGPMQIDRDRSGHILRRWREKGGRTIPGQRMLSHPWYLMILTLYVIKTRPNLPTYSKKPGNYNGTIIFEIDIVKNSSPLNLTFTSFAMSKPK